MGQVYKLCDCGFMNIFEESDAAPRRCSKCQRNILQKDTFPLDEYKKNQAQKEEEETTSSPEDTQQNQQGIFKLVNTEKNIVIFLPEHDDFILGREGIGSEYFGTTISRKHLYVTPTGRLGIRVTDKESLNGTKVNDELLPKGITKIVVPGNTLTLDINETGITFTLQRVE